MNPPSTSSKPVIAVRVRADLVAIETRHKHESAVVVKDPVAMKYHRLRPDEYFILERLDGTRSLEQLAREYEVAYLPQKVSQSEINQLLFRFHQAGLTLSDATSQGDRLGERRAKEIRQKRLQQLSSLLFIRFPGVDPEPFLRRIYPWIRPLLSPVALVAAALFCLSAGMAFLVHWGQFTSEFPSVGNWLRMESLLLLAVVISGTKILHELGHALACKHFGGECHQIGPMLLVFTPALYCDTSDSWMLPNRWARAAVGLAGIATELLLASIATWFWIMTGEGVIHSIAMNVMLVCGVSTVVFNANPLLRYDGYYVLSDLCDVPNLGERSRRLLAGICGRLFAGIREESSESFSLFGSALMLAYAVAAATYRWVLTLVIVWFVSQMLRPYGLQSLGQLLCVFAIVGMLYGLLRPPFTFLQNPVRRGKIQMNRLFVTLCASVVLVFAAMLPLPTSISSTARIVPRDQTSVYVSTPGTLAKIHAEMGSHVEKGDKIATLVNHEVETQYLQALGRVQTQTSLVEALKQSRFDSDEAANELPAAESLLKDLQDQLCSRQSRREALDIHAKSSGRLIAGARRPEERFASDETAFHLVNWSGYPTDAENSGSYLQSGTELLAIVTSNKWDAEIVMSQSEIQRIAVGAKVTLALQSRPASVFRASVSEISLAQWTPEMNTPRWDDPNAVRTQTPAATSYVVRARIEDSDVKHLLAGTSAISSVDAEPISLVGRVVRALNALMRFR